MGDTQLVSVKDLQQQKVPPDAIKKWLEAQLQEKKSSLFALKQQLDKCEQEIEDIREGKIKKIKYSMIMNTEQVKKISSELNVVDLS